MKLIKALLLIVSYINFSAIGHAVTIDPLAADTLYVTVNGAIVTSAPGRFDRTGETFFNVVFDNVGTTTGVGSSFDIDFSTMTGEILAVDSYLYKDDITNSNAGFFNESIDILVASASGLSESFSTLVDGSQAYFLKLVGIADANYEVNISAVSTVPVPAAGILFASVLLGAGLYGRRKKKSTANMMVGAFTRAS